MRITLVIGSLALGGAERLAAGVAEGWVKKGHAVTLITRRSVDDFFPVEPAVSRVRLKPLPRVRWLKPVGVPRLLRDLRAAIAASNPDVVVSSLEDSNVLTLAACIRFPVPVVLWSHEHFPVHREVLSLRVARRLLYRSASSMVVLTERTRGSAQTLLGERPVHVIPNFTSTCPSELTVAPRTRDADSRSSRESCILGMGRLIPSKGFDLLLEAFSRVCGRHPGWRLAIVGDGPERSNLERLARALGVADRVSMPGATEDPVACVYAADIFVLPSRTEGFPLVLLEAMACGRAIVAADCPTGPRELVRDGVNGKLVPPDDPHELAGALDQLMRDQVMRRRLGVAAASTSEDYSLERVLGLWEDALGQAVRAAKDRASAV